MINSDNLTKRNIPPRINSKAQSSRNRLNGRDQKIQNRRVQCRKRGLGEVIPIIRNKDHNNQQFKQSLLKIYKKSVLIQVQMKRKRVIRVKWLNRTPFLLQILKWMIRLTRDSVK